MTGLDETFPLALLPLCVSMSQPTFSGTDFQKYMSAIERNVIRLCSVCCRSSSSASGQASCTSLVMTAPPPKAAKQTLSAGFVTHNVVTLSLQVDWILNFRQTVMSLRSRGFATRLMAWVEQNDYCQLESNRAGTST